MAENVETVLFFEWYLVHYFITQFLWDVGLDTSIL